MGGCYSCMKYLFVLLNIIFLLFGVVGIAFATWSLVDPTFPLQLTQEYNDYLISVIILLVASVILLIVGILGIYSAIKKVRCAMIISFALLLIIVVAEVSAVIWGYMNREALELQIRTAVKSTVQEKYHQDKKLQELFDTFQEKLHCCGAEKPSDWSQSKELDMGVGTGGQIYHVPQSCCKETVSSSACQTATTLKIGSTPDSSVIYDRGCYSLIVDKIREHVCVILGVGGAVLAVQLLGLILALVLAFTMNRSNRYKA